MVKIGEVGAGEAWSGAGDCSFDSRDGCFWKTQIERELADQRLFARRRQSGLDVCERCLL